MSQGCRISKTAEFRISQIKNRLSLKENPMVRYQSTQVSALNRMQKKITDKAGTIIKAHFNVRSLAANRAMAVHLHVSFNLQRGIVAEQFALPAPGAQAIDHGC
jgi:hypothetical protein